MRERAVLLVHPNGAAGSALKREPVAHLFEDDENVTLCGRRRNTWKRVQVQEQVGEYSLCKRCEHIARIYHLEIPYE